LAGLTKRHQNHHPPTVQHGLFGSYDTEECAGVRFELNLGDVRDGLGSDNDWANGRYSCALVLTVEFTATTMTATLEIQTVINCWPRLYSAWIKALVHQTPLVFPWSTVFLGRARQARPALSQLPSSTQQLTRRSEILQVQIEKDIDDCATRRRNIERQRNI
jgi:hypothetical protein